MKLKELQRRIETYYEVNTYREDRDLDVVVIVKEPGMGARPSTPVKYANAGFDWERGLFVLETEQPVIRVKQEAKKIENLTPKGK